MKITRRTRFILLVILMATVPVHAQVPLEGTTVERRSDLPHAQGFVAAGGSVQQVMASLGARLGTPSIVSAKAQKKAIKGTFDLDRAAQTLDQITADVGLIWYTDRQSLYVYDASEAENVVGHLEHASLATLLAFLTKAGLADPRYPLRGGAGDGTFYLAAPPVYVQIVSNAARYIDALYRDADRSVEHIEVIKLQHTFVNARRFRQREVETVIPGMADTILQVLAPAGWVTAAPPRDVPAGGMESVEPEAGAFQGSAGGHESTATALAPVPAQTTGNAVIMAYRDANSLVVRGTLDQIQVIRNVVAQLDVPRKQVELSLWIIDVKRNDLAKLGVQWGGEVGIGRSFGAALNQGNVASTIDGARFLASISALSQTGAASVVSRPILLTQENVPALFDSNNSIYTKLLAERTASLETITFGTMVSVLPRVSDTGDVEMQIGIEDGSASAPESGNIDGIPVVGRTVIDTVARVPRNLSLLVGGYTRRSEEEGRGHLPGLGKIPFLGAMFRHRNSRRDDVARLFLIQPRVIVDSALPDRDAAARLYSRDMNTSMADTLERLRQPASGAAE